MPKEILDIKRFLQISKNVISEKPQAAQGAAKKPVPKKALIIKHGKRITKFKLRGPSYLYTYKTAEKDKATKLIQSLPQGLEKIEIKSKKILNKKRRR